MIWNWNHWEPERTGMARQNCLYFLIIPDNDNSFAFVMGMLYTQIFETLIHVADLEYHGPLPVPVEVWMDEFAN